MRSKLGESIEKALRQMRCPNPVQAHQVQGLDMKSLFPAVQWLVKKMLETRAETEASVKRTANLNFGKHFQLPAEAEREQREVCGVFLSVLFRR